MPRRKLIARNKRKTTLRLFLVLLIALLVIGAVVGAVLALSKRGTARGETQLPFSAAATSLFTGNGFLYLSENKLNYMDLSDERKGFSLDVSTTDVRLSASKTVYALYNNLAVQIVGASFPTEFAGTVKGVKCGVSHVAVLRQDAAGRDAVMAFSATGEQVKTNEPTGGMLMDYGFCSDGEDTLWTLALDASSTTPVQTLVTYDLAKAATTGVITVSGELLEEVLFNAKSVFAVTTSNLVRYTRVGNAEAYRVLIYGSKLVDASFLGTRPLFLFVPRENAAPSSVLLLSVDEAEVSGERRVHLQLPAGTLKAVVAKGKLLAYCPGAVYTYSEKGTLLSTEVFETPIDGAEKLSESYMLLRRGDALSLAPIR